jgi:tetratricopeptide (TPR) repeat protein
MALSNTAFGLGSTITQHNVTGTPPEVLVALIRQHENYSETQKKLISRLETDLDLNQRQIRGALEILGEANIPLERLGAKLVEIAEQFKILQAAAAAQSDDTAEIAAQKAEAKGAIEAGDLAKADVLLAEIQEAKRRTRGQLKQALDQSDIEDAETSAQRGDIALARLRYAEAAQHFAEAARTLPVGHDQERWNYLVRQADALYRQGDEFGDNAALAEAIDITRRCLVLAPRSERPLDWARTQVALGNALLTLGARDSGTARLEEAVAAYREALQEFTRERVPLDWAMSTGNQGVALMLLAERRHHAEVAKLAVQQIEAAFTTSRDGGDAPSAAYFEAQLPKARAIRDKLHAP